MPGNEHSFASTLKPDEPFFVLKNLRENHSEDKEFWDEALPALRNFFQGAVFNEHHFSDCLIDRSLAEYEDSTALKFSANDACGPDWETLRRGVRWIHRQFEGGVESRQDVNLTDMKLFVTSCVNPESLPRREESLINKVGDVFISYYV